MEIIVKENRELIIKNPESTQNENDVQTIYLTVPEQYEDFDKKIAFVTENGVKWGLVENNAYKLERSITKFENVSVFVWLTKGEQDFRSAEEPLHFNKNHKVDGEITPEERSSMEEAIAVLESEISKVEHMDIDAIKEESIATITITDKFGNQKVVHISDGEDGIDGVDGENGFSPTIRTIETTDGYDIEITDISGTNTITILNGKNGKNGLNGQDGKDGVDGQDGAKGEKGDPGSTGATGNGIANITKTGTSGLVDTYTITYTNGTTTSFQVTNGESGTTDYSDLENKPKINNVELNGNKSLQDLGVQPRGDYALNEDIPTKTSELQNDSGFITGYTETDPTVPSHVKNISQADISNWNNKSDFSGDYEDLDNQPSINGVTLLGNKTAEELGITSSLCNLGKFSDYPQDNRLNLNKLTPGVYLLYRDVSNIYVKATYKDNEILGEYLLRESTLDNIYFLTMHKRITDDLSVGSYVGKFISFKVKDGASSMVKEESTSIEIYSDTIRIDTGTTNTINTVTRDNSQTITGKKTFNTLPESSVVPTTDNQLVNKKYVDDSIGDIETALTTITTGSGV